MEYYVCMIACVRIWHVMNVCMYVLSVCVCVYVLCGILLYTIITLLVCRLPLMKYIILLFTLET